MKQHLLIKALAGSGLMLMTLGAQAQYQPRPEGQYQDEHAAREQARVFERVRADLDRAGALTMPFSGDRDRVARARERLNDCQQAVASGEFDRRTFGETIASIQRVVNMNRLSDRNRDLLTDDMNALRDMQERLGA